MQWSIEDTPGHVINFLQGHPWEKPDDMRKGSPLFAVDKVRTPTLFHVGGNDERCPPGHQKAMYRALHEYLNVPCELVVYPGEGHGLTKYESRKAKMEWDIAWFKRHLLGEATEPPPRKPADRVSLGD
jgi:dipeptidyl aminopeptidase/acylaminoacyl peptidase